MLIKEPDEVSQLMSEMQAKIQKYGTLIRKQKDIK